MKLLKLIVLILFVQNVFAQSPITVKGQIICGKQNLQNVFVTDGENYTLTDKNGRYTLHTTTLKDFVYYTSPTGYDPLVKHGMPLFFQKINKDQQIYNFELVKAVDQKQHAFLVWADPQVMEVAEFDLLKAVANDMNEMALLHSKIPVHAICLGDIVFDQPQLFDPYKEIVASIDLPFYHVVGNHDMDYTDLTHETSTKTFQEKFGPAYYSYNKGEIHYVVLNDVFYYGYQYQYMGYIDQKQLNWLAADLQQVKKGSTVVVSLHIPTKYHDAEVQPDLQKRQKNTLINGKALYSLLDNYQTHILAGHSHTQWNTQISNNILEHTHVAACGAWWQGAYGLDGTPIGYGVYTVDGSKIKWQYKTVGKGIQEQFRMYVFGGSTEANTYIIANVFNYDPQWKVYWTENGKRMGEMEQYWGEDPLAAQLYSKGKNKKYSWLEVDQTNHLFRATPLDPKAQLGVEVIDRFGEKYTSHAN